MAVCENCAGERDDDELVPVWAADASGAEETQLWCSDCRTKFAHEPADDDDDSTT